MQLSTELEKRLRELLHVFLVENQNINLSALRTEEACWIGNILDSLAFVDALPSFSNLQSPFSTLLDLGTGGGFPLLPLAIALPNLDCTGLDAIGKKLRAVEHIAHELQLKNVHVMHERSEVLGRDPKHREKYDIVTSRAVAELSVLIEWTSPFVKVGGTIILWKSLHIDEELQSAKRAMEECLCSLEKTYRYELPGDFGERQLLILRKTGELHEKYPRAVGEAKKNPL